MKYIFKRYRIEATRYLAIKKSFLKLIIMVYDFDHIYYFSVLMNHSETLSYYQYSGPEMGRQCNNHNRIQYFPGNKMYRDHTYATDLPITRVNVQG